MYSPDCKEETPRQCSLNVSVRGETAALTSFNGGSALLGAEEKPGTEKQYLFLSAAVHNSSTYQYSLEV